MGLTAGIVGLPNIGKSTLFNAITKSEALVANYPFATKDPNVGVVEVPDERMPVLVKMFDPRRVVYNTFSFTDIAGLVKGASKGEGLGNQFLSNIREVNLICHVARCFEDADITHVEGEVDPVRDIEIVNTELVMADLESVEAGIAKVERKAKSKEKAAIVQLSALTKIREHLLKGEPARMTVLNKDEAEVMKSFHLLTVKPVIYVANMSEDDVANPEGSVHYKRVKELAEKENAPVLPICAKIEEELAGMEEEEKKMFLEDLGIEKAGLDQVVQTAYEMLGLRTFFTVGKDEVRAWTFKEGTKAPQAAGIIHTDFERGFIKAEIYSYDDLMTYGSEAGIKEAGKLRIEGKEYVMKDGDIVFFRFNV
ncbi:MAG: redox-regulated ATPase YchF [Erysipelotrichales bacterium]|nr:redox-regulated ATPase YchF [Erysipelotrichales bacterium]MBQ4011982.1 redox-regulated ATPase YchF [Erysipelotrichales bacterium]